MSIARQVFVSIALVAALGAGLRCHAQTNDPASAASTAAQRAAAWQAAQAAAALKSDDIMRRADQRKGLLAQYQTMRNAYDDDRGRAFRLIFNQYLSWYQTFLGDYRAAALSFSIRQVDEPDDARSPLEEPGYTAHAALGAIAELAKKRQIVMLNEAHNIPLTRTLTIELLPKLRAEGYEYFGVETLYQSDTGLAARGYPVATSGFYTREPLSGEMVRTALRLGFKVFGYEALSAATGDAREAEQAANIYAAVFKEHPHARLVLEAGYAHIQKSGPYLGGASMAEHLHQLTGIDALAVEQTMMAPHPHAEDDHPYYRAIWRGKLDQASIETNNSEATGYTVNYSALDADAPIVYLDKSGKPWSLRPGYDVSVIFPPEKLRYGRPTWLALGGLRVPYFVSGDACRRRYPCLVEARYAAEGSDAIPADRMVLDPLPANPTQQDLIQQGQATPVGQLYLRPGAYRLGFFSRDGSPIYQQDITVGADGRSRARPAAPAPAASRPGPVQP